MAGHSKWANIKHRKAAQDAKRGKIFTKIIREIVTATKLGGSDVSSNSRLRTAIDKALSTNMTRDTINRAIARGAGGEDDSNMESITYEGYGPQGTAVMVECLTDNRNRTAPEVRHCFSKCSGNLGSDGSVNYLFTKLGVILIDSKDENAVMESALELGATEIITHEEGIEVQTPWEDFLNIKDSLEEKGFKIISGEVTQIASTTVELDDDNVEKFLKLIDMLEDCDDVQEIYHNAEISDEQLARLN